ncbi:MAG: hypothetical protein KAS78_03940 [Candidatus Pacebacteria bacterium]|nr:hypothetical protein [Candidatus Paceibacterota bacterium]
MRIVEDITRVKKKGKEDLLKNYNAAKKAAVSSRVKNKIPAQTAEEKITKSSGLENLIISNKRLIFGMIVVLLVLIGLFLYNSDKDIPVSIENISAELKKENELLEKEISEAEDNNDTLRNVNRKIEQLD